MTAPSPPPVPLDPPFRGYIETTFDALLVFEAARRGMIPRVTRRLIERERGMVQSGAVFVFDEHESGIKRWTDGLVWSPSRILGNFLVYRETDKRSTNPAISMPNPNPTSISPPQHSPSSAPLHRPGGPNSLPGTAQYAESSHMTMTGTPPDPGPSDPPPVLGSGALYRPLNSNEGVDGIDRHRERQLVGSLTNSYKFKDGGLVKKTMSVTVNGFAQHMISYYSVEDVFAGKLRCPSTIPELASLEISQEYLHKQNFRFPPMIEVGQDGVPRYRGEPEETTMPQSPRSNLSIQSLPTSSSGEMYDQYVGSPHQSRPPQSMRVLSSSQPRQRSVTVPMSIQLPSPDHPHNFIPAGPSSAGSGYFDAAHSIRPPPIARHASSSSLTSGAGGAMRPGSSNHRFEPYSGGPSLTSPRMSIPPQLDYDKRQPQTVPQYFSQHLDPNKPASGMYQFQSPSTAPGSFANYYRPPPNNYGSPYATTAWAHSPSQSSAGRPIPREYSNDPPSSAGSSGNTGQPPGTSSGPGPSISAGGIGVVWGPPGHWEGAGPGPGQYSQGDWRDQGQGTGVAQ